MMKISQQVTKLFASDRPNWEKWEKLTEIAAHAQSLADSLLDGGYDFDYLDDAIAIAIYEDRTQTVLPPPHRCSVAGCLRPEEY